MKTSFKISLADAEFLTRTQGRRFREIIQKRVTNNEIVEVDLGNLPVSPSFADECFGLLIKDIGRIKFKSHVKLVNLTSSSKAIILHVLKQQSSMAA